MSSEGVLKQLQAETRKYQDMPIVMQRLNECGHLDTLYSLYKNIFVKEQAFMTQELFKIVNDLDSKRKKVNLNIQVQLNAQIFKQNFELITSNLLKIIFNEIYPDSLREHKDSTPPEPPLSQSRKISDNMLQNMSVRESQILPDQTYSKFPSTNEINPPFSSSQHTAQPTKNKKKGKISLKSSSRQKSSQQHAKYNQQLSMFNNQLKNMSSISYINPIDSQFHSDLKKDDFSIDNHYSGHSQEFKQSQKMNLTLNSNRSEKKGNFRLNSSQILNKFMKKESGTGFNQSMMGLSFMTNQKQDPLAVDSEFSFRSHQQLHSTFSKQKRGPLFKKHDYLQHGPKYDIQRADKHIRSQSPCSTFGKASKRTWIDQIQASAVKKQVPGPKYNPSKKATSTKKTKKKT